MSGCGGSAAGMKQRWASEAELPLLLRAASLLLAAGGPHALGAMSYVKPADRVGGAKQGAEEGEAAPIHRIRITLTSTKVKNLEKVCATLVQGAKEKALKVKGPVRMPTRRLVHTVRKAPSGNGTNTFDRFEMRVHKRLIDLQSPADVVKQITNISIEPSVEIEVTIADV